MQFEWFISSRYLFSRGHRALVSVITFISIAGVALGVAALIVVIGVIDGFDSELIDRMIGAFSHVEIWSAEREGIEDYEQLITQLQGVEEVTGVAPVIFRQALLQRTTGIRAPKVGVEIRGFDIERERGVTDVVDTVVVGKANPGAREVILGVQLAYRLRVTVGDIVYAVTVLTRTAHGPYPKTAQLKVAGIFKSGLYEVDANSAFTSLETMRDIFLLSDKVDYVHARIRDPYQASAVKRKVERLLPPYYIVRTWEELNPDFFRALRLEKLAMFVILLLIIIVAAFNIIGTLIMIVAQKTREIGMLKSMGATKGHVMRIFLYYGISIGVIGIICGLIIGLSVCFVLKNYIHYDLPEAIYGIDTLPVKVEPLTVFIIVVATIVICGVASIFPAWQASRLHPVEALRYE